MNYKEMAEIISKPWVDSDDIMKICCCGKNTAIEIRNSIEKIVVDSGKIVPPSMTKHVPTKLLLEHIGMDEEYIFKMALRQI